MEQGDGGQHQLFFEDSWSSKDKIKVSYSKWWFAISLF